MGISYASIEAVRTPGAPNVHGGSQSQFQFTALKVRALKPCTAEVRALKVRAREVRALKLRAGEVRALKLRVDEPRALKPCFAEVRVLKLYTREARTLKFCAKQNCTRHMCIAEIGAAKVSNFEHTAIQIAPGKASSSFAQIGLFASFLRGLPDFIELFLIDDTDAGQQEAVKILSNPSIAPNGGE